VEFPEAEESVQWRSGGEAGYSVNEIFRQHGAAYAETRRLSAEQRRVIRNLSDCRTLALGGHIEQCDTCEAVHYRYHSCRDRHCPQCGGLARAEWLMSRAEELLPVPYYHAVFTVDHIWNGLLRANQPVCYDLLYAVVSKLLKAYGQRYLGGEIGFILVLHTWGQKLDYHVHLHCIILGGALRADGQFRRSQADFLFPVVELSAEFRDALCLALLKVYQTGTLQLTGDWADEGFFATQLVRTFCKKWEVYLKPPFGKAETVLEYLSGYVNRIAISNRRITAVVDDTVTFTYRDYRDDGKVKLLPLPVAEFMRRFLLHVLPAGFVRIRYYGLWHPCQRHKLALCRQQIVQNRPGIDPQSLALFFRPPTDEGQTLCPACGEGNLVCIGEFAGTRPRLPHRRRARPLLATERQRWLA
jgi:hypothetical protein